MHLILGRIRDNEASHRKMIEQRKKFLGESEVKVQKLIDPL